MQRRTCTFHSTAELVAFLKADEQGPYFENTGYSSNPKVRCLYLAFPEQLWSLPQCQFCTLLSAAVKRKYDPEGLQLALQEDKLHCKLYWPTSFKQHEQKITDHPFLEVEAGVLIEGQFVQSRRHYRGNQGECRLAVYPVQKSWSLNIDLKCLARKPLQAKFDASLLLNWMSICQHEHLHKDVNQDKGQLASLALKLRFRLIDVIARELHAFDYVPQYLALSYVWGRSTCHETVVYANPRQSLPESASLVSSIDWEKVPRTIRDAADLVASLGERYLWVDGLCINQSDTSDKAEIISAMSAIYNGALLTIVAADGEDADNGLQRFQPNPALQDQYACITADSGDEDLFYVLTPHTVEDTDTVLGKTKWASRAWTYQEQLLSSRCVFFTPEEVYFKCGHSDFREAYELVTGSPRLHIPPPDTQRPPMYYPASYTSTLLNSFENELIFGNYADFVYTYTRRDITFPGDRLDAFSAVLERFREPNDLPDQILAESGIPLRFMFSGLLWQMESGFRIDKDQRGSRSFPSWSWVGWFGPVGWGSIGSPWSGNKYIREKSDLDFEMLDAHNIVASPPSEHVLWPDWTTSPNLQQPRKNGDVTIHLHARVFRVRLQQSEKVIASKNRRDDIILLSEDHSPCTDPMISGYVDHAAPIDYDHTYEIICLRESSYGYDGIIVDFEGGFHFRCSTGFCSILGGRRQDKEEKIRLQKYWYKKYIMLR